MKMIKVNHKLDWGLLVKFYNFNSLKKVEYNEKFESIKLFIDVDIIEGVVEKFDVDKFERFSRSSEKMVFEICVA